MKKLFVLLFACVSVLGYAQAPEVLPQVFSPNAAELGKYGKVPVSYFNGLPNISIPLTELKAKDYTLPIYLTYYAGGNKPDQHPGWVGLGWTLHAGGCINRIVHGGKDEETAKEYMHLHFTEPSFDPGHLHHAAETQLTNWMDEDSYSNLPNSHMGSSKKDLEPDEFLVSVDGIQATFYFTGPNDIQIVSQSGGHFTATYELANSKDIREIKLVDNYDDHSNKIDRVKLFDYIKTIHLTADDGTRYTFGGNFDTIEFSISFTPIGENRGKVTVGQWRSIANTWHLTSIERPNGEQVSFEYERNGMPISVVDSHYSETIVDHLIPDDPWPLSSSFDYNTSCHYSILVPSYLKRVYSRCDYDEICFHTSNSTELEYNIDSDYFRKRIPISEDGMTTIFSRNYYRKLDRIETRSGSIDMTYTSDSTSRLKLMEVKMKSPTDTGMCYKMEYNLETLLPKYNSRKTDAWGYYASESSYSCTSDDISTMNERRRIVDSDLMQAEMLIKLTYPTGGFTLFKYEPHTFHYVAETFPFYLKRESGTAGGLRIKKIIDYSLTGQKEERAFSYSKEGHSSGILAGYPSFYETGQHHSEYFFDNWYGLLYYAVRANYDFDYQIFSEQTLITLPTTRSNIVTYSCVTEERPGIGKTEYSYTNHDSEDYPCMDLPPRMIYTNMGFHDEKIDNIAIINPVCSAELYRGLLKSRKDYDCDNHLVRHEINTYDALDTLQFVSAVADYDISNVLVRFSYYKVFTGFPALTHKVVMTYPDDGGDPLVEETDYEYNDHRQLFKTTRRVGSGIEETQVLYSGDASLANNSPYSEMQAAGILNWPVEQTVLRDGKVISSSLTTYKPSSEYFQDVFVPDKNYEARLKEPCSLAKWEQCRYKGVFTDKQKEFYGDPKISFDSYSGYNNISLATEENGLSHRFIWDDDALFPEAHFTGELSTKSVTITRETAKKNVNFWGESIKEYTFEFDVDWPDAFSFVMVWPDGIDYEMTGTMDGKTIFRHRPRPGGGGGVKSLSSPSRTASTEVNQDFTPETELYKGSVSVGHHVFKVSRNATKTSSGKGKIELPLEGECHISYPVSHIEESISNSDVYYYDFEDDGGWSYAFNSDRGWPGEFVVTKQCPSGTSYRMDWMQQDCKGGVWKSHTAPYTGPTTIGENAYAIDNIRIYPADAMATCWTWSQYGELRSIMNESGLTSSYDYDGLGRLVATRNTDGKLVSSYNYHYPTSDNPYAYVKTSQYRDEAGTTDKAMHILGYVDGLGRPWQTIRQNASGNGIHLAEQTDYDAAGRPFRTWLPFLTATLLPQTTTPSDTTLYSDSEPFSLVEYDGSPQDRPRLEYGPGKSWHSNGKAVRHGYYTNGSSAALNCKRFTLTWSGDTTAVVSNNGNIPSATLSVKSITDEDGLTLLTFTNMYGQTLLERRLPQSGANLDTYYIYDGLGRLSVVLPPAIAEKQTVSQSDIDKYAYLYRYDARGNCIAKKLPGCGWTYYIYDKGSRLLFSQDAENRKLGRWVFSFSDIHGRNCLSGICEGERETLSNTASTANIVASRKKKNNALLLMDYYISNVQLSNPIVLSASYYDDYNHVSTNMLDPLDFCPQYGLQRKDDVHGLLTGTAERILGEDITNEFRWETYYYDEKGNILQTQTTREDGGVNITTTEWSFTGKPVRMNITHHYGESQESTEYYEYSYDDWDRPLTTKHRLGENAEWTTLSDISYDAIGRVAATECNGNPDLTTTHTYNVRSWKKSIAGPGMSENLTYEDYDRWNGNITSASYDYDGTTLHHDYTYDGLSRLVRATTVTGIESSSELYNYDAHSNVIAYERSGMDAISKSMSYNGNRMTSVTSSLPGASGSIGYDSIGRVISSDIEGMTEVKYNVVGYPAFIGQADGGYVHHTYTAGGARMASRRTDAAGVVTLMEYEGNEVRENGKLRMLLFDGGYVDFSGEKPRYCWYTKDHLGSVRAVADADGNVFATYAYRPYGEEFAALTQVAPGTTNSTSQNSQSAPVSHGGGHLKDNEPLYPTVNYSPAEGPDWQPFKFSGKESLTRVGLDLYDFGARMYSPSNMRWMTMDPLCEKFYDISPYVYCHGSPVTRIDIGGRWDITVHVYSNRKEYGYGIAVVTNNNGKEIYRFTVRAQGVKGNDRMKRGGDTPLGVYNIPDSNPWISGGSRASYGPNARLNMEGESGEIVSSGRSNIRIHGGRQETYNGSEWEAESSPSLKKTYGCLRAYDSDMSNLITVTNDTSNNNPDDTPGKVTVVDDLEKRTVPTSSNNLVEAEEQYVIPTPVNLTGSL